MGAGVLQATDDAIEAARSSRGTAPPPPPTSPGDAIGLGCHGNRALRAAATRKKLEVEWGAGQRLEVYFQVTVEWTLTWRRSSACR